MKDDCCRKNGVVDLGGGFKAPAYGTNPKVIDMAKEKTTGIVKMDEMPKKKG